MVLFTEATESSLPSRGVLVANSRRSLQWLRQCYLVGDSTSVWKARDQRTWAAFELHPSSRMRLAQGMTPDDFVCDADDGLVDESPIDLRMAALSKDN